MSEDSDDMLKTGGIVVDRDRHLLIIKGRNSQKWGVPKGGVDPNDQSVLRGALREIYEETGLRIHVDDRASVDYWIVYKCRLYIFDLQAKQPRLNPVDTDEIIEARWLNLADSKEVEVVLNEATKMLKSVLKRLLKHFEGQL